MVYKFMSLAILVASVCSADAQSLGSLGGPSNLPPAGFSGQQFVDSRGCVFLKAGLGGQTNWVPRVGRNRKALCGFPPSFGPRAAIEVAEDTAPVVQEPMVMAAKPAPVRTAPAPMAVQVQKPVAARVAAATVPTASYVPAPVTQQAAPYATSAPRGTYEVASNGVGAGQIGCFTSAPVAERVKLRNGGTAVVCTRGDGTLTGWRSPLYPAGSRVGAALSDTMIVTRSSAGTANGGYVGGSDEGVAYAADSQSGAVPTPPKGYVLAWKDDRLNPNRGKGTAEGWAAQDQVWTRKTPARLAADEPRSKRKKVVYVTKGSNVTVSTKSVATETVQPKAQVRVAKGGAFVQVGTFGVASNADGASSRLKSLGLPVARSKITSGGKPMQIVLAGPFGSVADAQSALAAARRAGFVDAFIR